MPQFFKRPLKRLTTRENKFCFNGHTACAMRGAGATLIGCVTPCTGVTPIDSATVRAISCRAQALLRPDAMTTPVRFRHPMSSAGAVATGCVMLSAAKHLALIMSDLSRFNLWC